MRNPFERMKKGYFKVVRLEDNRMYSSTVREKRHRAEYRKGKKTRRLEENGPLAVFSDIDNAREFFTSLYISLIGMVGLDVPVFRMWKCSIRESKDHDIWVTDLGNPKRINLWGLPPGTVLADVVKLEEEVDP